MEIKGNLDSINDIKIEDIQSYQLRNFPIL